jgi:hypothetical protein
VEFHYDQRHVERRRQLDERHRPGRQRLAGLQCHDLHATILRLMGLDHMRLVYTHNGRPERPTLNEGAAHPKLAG